MTVPLGSTTSTPSTLARMEPYRSSRRPPETMAEQVSQPVENALGGLHLLRSLLIWRQVVLHVLFHADIRLRC